VGGVLLLMLVAVGSTQAQWQQAAPYLLPPPLQHVGALRARGAVAWAGTTALYYSNDTGVTWQESMTFPSSSGVMDIAIYDSLEVLVGTQSDGLYLTTDAGQTWINMSPNFSSAQPMYTQVAFDGSDSVLLALSYNSSTLYTSTNRGINWAANQTTNTSSVSRLRPTRPFMLNRTSEAGAGSLNQPTWEKPGPTATVTSMETAIRFPPIRAIPIGFIS